MPEEVRYVAFAPAEIEAIFASGLPWLGYGVPGGSVSCVRVDARSVRVRFEDDSTGEMQVVQLRPEEVGACVLRWCRQQGVPAAQRFSKRLESAGGRLVLVLSQFDGAGPAAAALGLGAGGADQRSVGLGHICHGCARNGGRCLLEDDVGQAGGTP